MRFPIFYRVLLIGVPMVFTIWGVMSVIWGEYGLLARHQLQAELVQAQAELASVDRDNQRLLRELRTMERDPVVIERMVADELRWGRPGEVLYDFGGEEDEEAQGGARSASGAASE